MVKIFADTFQSSFKDCLGGKIDYRIIPMPSFVFLWNCATYGK